MKIPNKQELQKLQRLYKSLLVTFLVIDVTLVSHFSFQKETLRKNIKTMNGN